MMMDPNVVARLNALGKLWGKAKLFHPHLATRNIDWDGALIRALPGVRDARTPDQYRVAIDAMLAALADADTGTQSEEVAASQQSAAAPDARPSNPLAATPTYFRLISGIVVLACYEIACLFDREGTNSALELAAPSLDSEIRRARGVILDCRFASSRSERHDFKLRFMFKNYVREQLAELVDRPVTLGTYRIREHSGYAPHTGFSSGGYGCALSVVMPATLQGRAAGKCPPLAVILNEHTPDQRSLLGGLQSAGLATIIHEGPSDRSGAAAPQGGGIALTMTDGISVRLRTTEFVNPDGRIGWIPDVGITATQRSDGGHDAAIEAALASIADRRTATSRAGEATTATAPTGYLEQSYADMTFPDADHRLLGLFRFWTVIEHFFPYKHLMDRDWSTLVADFIPRFEANKSTLDYQTTMTELAVCLQDSHVNIANAQVLEEHCGLFSPPVNVSVLEKETVITALREQDLKATTGLALGDVILAIDGEPVAQRRARIAQHIPSSTPQALCRAVNGQLLRGPKDSTVRLHIRGADGPERDATIKRTVPWRSVAYPPDRDTPAVYQVLPSGYGYIDLDRLAFSEVDKAMAAIQATPAAIFDIRGYPQGTGFRIAPRLVAGHQHIVGAIFRRPYWRGDWIGNDDASTSEHVFAQQLASNNAPRYAGKVVVLINEQAQSQSEHTCMAFAAATDVTFIGSPTAGANGDITNFILPGNLVVTFTGHDVRHPDGRQLQRIGIQPHVYVRPTIAGIRAGRDEVLEAAVSYLQARG
jgi:C-terminal processing protease CtpA/Prc